MDQPYFSSNTFEEISRLYETCKENMRRKMNVIKNDPSSNMNQSAFVKTKLSESIALIDVQYDEIMDLINSANEIDESTSTGYINAHLKLMTTTWDDLRSSIQTSKVNGDDIAFDYAQLMKEYMVTYGSLQDFIDKKRSISNSNTNVSSTQFLLPKIQLPQFSGQFADWKNFISIFNRMIHNNKSLDDGMKIEYLKTCIKGDAARLIKHVNASPENYSSCYDILINRFENKREIMNKLIDNMFNLPKMKNENVNQLKNLHDVAHESIMSIKNLDINVSNWDPLLNHILMQKLDSATVIHYECQLENVKEPQSLDSFLSYIQKRFLALQSAMAKRENSNNTSSSNFSEKNNDKPVKKYSCVFCKESHSISSCTTFLKKDVKDRITWIKDNKYCVNCTGSHKTSDCASKFSCQTCKKSTIPYYISHRTQLNQM